jgi:hypothetical protein
LGASADAARNALDLVLSPGKVESQRATPMTNKSPTAKPILKSFCILARNFTTKTPRNKNISDL